MKKVLRVLVSLFIGLMVFVVPAQPVAAAEGVKVVSSVAKVAPSDSLKVAWKMARAVDIVENKLLRGRYSGARFSGGEVYFSVRGFWIKMSLVDTPVELAPKIEKNKIKYSTSDLDVEYSYLDTVMKEVITLNKPMPVVFSYQLNKGGSLRSNPDGSLSMLMQGVKEILRIERPFAIDKSGVRFELGYKFDNKNLILAGDLSSAKYPIIIDPTYTVIEGFLDSDFSSSRSIARKSNGDLWCTYSRATESSVQIFCSYSTDGGGNWTEEQVTDLEENWQGFPVIAIDSEDNVHVAWTGTGWGSFPDYKNIQYRKKTTSWQVQESISDIADDQWAPAIAIDSNDNVHVVWSGKGWGDNPGVENIEYRRSIYSWETRVPVTDSSSEQWFPAMAIDSEDNVYVVWQSPDDIQYREKFGAYWLTQESITDVGDQGGASIAIDSENNVHVVWSGYGWGNNPDYWNIQYREKTTSWQTQESVTDINNDQTDASISTSLDNHIHIVWSGWGWGSNPEYINIEHREKTTSWQAQESVTDDETTKSYYLCLLYALHPISVNRPFCGYAVVWRGDAVFYSASDDLTWGVPQFNPTISLQGSSRPPAGYAIQVTVKFFAPGSNVMGTPLFSATTNTDKVGSNATCTVTAPIGTYDVTIDNMKTLTNVIHNQTFTAGSTTSAYMGKLLEGNCYHDLTVNVKDGALLVTHYDPLYTSQADFNEHGEVNISDGSLLLHNYGLTSPVSVD